MNAMSDKQRAAVMESDNRHVGSARA